MIPIKLEVKNFLSYGPILQTVDFGPYPLICLSGKNGHGKSALLDAMTWAIWGQARKASGTAKADSNLLHLGQTQMLVCFEFSFNNQTYRIKREFAKTYGKPVAALEFGIIDQGSNEFKTLTDKTIRATQEKIEATIGLNYDAFINSAFLKQGQSNEFSKKSPKERKEIIGRILGLDQYELLRKRSMEKSKEFSNKKALLSQHNEAIEKELEKKPELLERLNLLNKELAELEKEQDASDKNRTVLEGSQQILIKQEQTRALYEQQCNSVNEQLTKVSKNLEEILLTWRQQHRLLKSADNKEELEKEYNALKAVIKKHQTVFTEQLTIKEKLLSCKEHEQKAVQLFQEQYRKRVHDLELNKAAIEKEKTGFISECQQLLKQIKENGQNLKETVIIRQTKEKELPKTACDNEAFGKAELIFEKRKSHYHGWIAQANSLKTELDQLQQKMKFTQDSSQPSCPLCEQNLSASRKKFLQQKFAHDYQHLTHQLTRFKKVLSSLKELLLIQHKELEGHKKITEQTTIIHAALSQLTEHEAKLMAHNERLEKEQTELLKKRDSLEKNLQELDAKILALNKEEERAFQEDKVIQEIRNRRQELEEALKKNAYDPDAHKNDLEQFDKLETNLSSLSQIQEEALRQKEREKEIKARSLERKTILKELTTLQAEAKQFEHLKKERINLIEQAELLNKKNKELATKKETYIQEKGRIESEQAHLKKLEERAESFLKDAKELGREIEDYETIAQALGKDGIQALLIEQALPEIEAEANALLSLLTDNQSHIIIDSVRDLKKGGTKETLDIKISDAAGIRPYEMFSGGEAFRIDFALRIAISKLLARRAGTSLQTLIIDEGFGSQDDDGLNNIMESIHRIQENFCKIIIVSHLPSMKDQFPVHFCVEKLAQGSVVNIIQQG